jgi:hypothetical protein
MHHLTRGTVAARAHAFDHFRAKLCLDATPAASALVGRRIDISAVPQRVSYERVPELELFEICRADEAAWSL